ncbi:hypothetical protein OZ410_13360 [Robiginitalea sp. M366]|uniref:hypothetical protein n=1 Tax=Robiginitalea aestuariiviva TaxID=3036903 RepID=UPI00240E84C7|nr:hypothetical protein [Robiginitalea aestuariiviva]MDG1573311.1 hypothetical protein [Robiginitalea aestuariiviva]
MTPESIAALAACIASDKFTNGMSSRGNIPSNPSIAMMFRQSGFFDHVSILDYDSGRSKGAKLIHKRSDKKVESSDAKNICRRLISKTDYTYIDELEPMYVILIEAMQNTNNHASAGKPDQYDWWLYQYEDPEKKLLHYTFLDIGVGVFESLPVRDFKRKFMELFSIKNNSDLVRPLLKGEIKSRTLQPNRGKGIPQIYDQSFDDLFEEFHILSNDILINTRKKSHIRLSNQFYGTLYYWSVKIN